MLTAFALIHGAWHGAWCWTRVQPLLEQAGHHVLAPDLPDLDADRMPPDGRALAGWTDHVVACLRAERPVKRHGSRGGTVLVGHSRGGVVISSVAERAPELVDRLVYIAAFLLQDGQSVQQVARTDAESILGRHVVLDPARGTVTVREKGVAACFYGECDEKDIAFARARLRPESLTGLAAPVRVSDVRFGTIPRYYIECSRDRAIGLACQRRMQAGLPCRATVTLDTDHSPFFSSPEALVAALVHIAGH